ncbi:MAG: hypothetical protein R2874_13740 [Desulfobacterales bacterium]
MKYEPGPKKKVQVDASVKFDNYIDELACHEQALANLGGGQERRGPAMGRTKGLSGVPGTSSGRELKKPETCSAEIQSRVAEVGRQFAPGQIKRFFRPVDFSVGGDADIFFPFTVSIGLSESLLFKKNCNPGSV